MMRGNEHEGKARRQELDVITAHPLRVDAAATRAELARRGERASGGSGHGRSARTFRLPAG
jgi:hypothetical protein